MLCLRDIKPSSEESKTANMSQLSSFDRILLGVFIACVMCFIVTAIIVAGIKRTDGEYYTYIDTRGLHLFLMSI